MNASIYELIEKWEEVGRDEDDWTIKNLSAEFVEDLRYLTHE